MTRETKSQRLARKAEEQAAHQAAREAQERAEYFPRLMRVLARTTKLYWQIDVPVENMFKLHVRNSDRLGDGISYSFPAEYDPREMWRLSEAEEAVELAERELEEANRKIMLRAAALNKLSTEEREALGL